MILDEIIEKRKIQLENEKAKISFDEIKEKALNSTFQTRDFKKALSGKNLSVICEVKKASPSKGLIRPDFHPLKIAKEYELSGADAISCLTEEYYFKGSSDYLKEISSSVNIPVLRKDFIIDEYQIYEARVMGASAILLIAAVLDEETMMRFYKLAASLSLQSLVEVHNESELQKALNIGAEIIGINNRNLKTFEVDLNTTGKLASLIPDDKLIVSESGIKDNTDMKTVHSLGASAVLIGETLMRSDDIANTLKELRENV